MEFCLVQFPLTLSPQNGDSAVIKAVVGYQPSSLRELVRAGSDLNLQNQVRASDTVDTAHHLPPLVWLALLGGAHCSDGGS